ncbi:uncharacterized protein LOC129003893 [Macrosteles quadrilineatus]|nr:uncharacterized protein LOC129003893 [Macrosteles quadrilineatus]
MAGSSSVSFVKSLYYDPFKWSLVKSFGCFLLGIAIAKEFKGVEVMPAIV